MEYVTFLSLNKKVTKEISLKGAELIAPAIKAAPLRIPRPASPVALEHLNINPVQEENVPIFFLKYGASEDGWAEIGTFPPLLLKFRA